MTVRPSSPVYCWLSICPQSSVWIIILGALFAIGVGKMSFGGLGNNPFNPALAGRVFLLLSFPVQMTTWPVVGQLTAYADATTGATPLAIMKGVINGAPGVSLDQLPDSLSLLIGQNGGCLGEVSAAALLLGLIYMLWKKIISGISRYLFWSLCLSFRASCIWLIPSYTCLR